MWISTLQKEINIEDSHPHRHAGSSLSHKLIVHSKHGLCHIKSRGLVFFPSLSLSLYKKKKKKSEMNYNLDFVRLQPWEGCFSHSSILFFCLQTQNLWSHYYRTFAIIRGEVTQRTLRANSSWWEHQFALLFLTVTHVSQPGFLFPCVGVQKSTSFTRCQYPLNNSAATTELEWENDPIKC